jgi:recombination protein RecT
MNQANALVPFSNPEAVRSDLTTIRPQLADVLPRGVDADRFVRVVARAIIGNPKLMECTRASILTSVLDAAALGLEPTGLLGSAYLVPYQRKVKVPHPSNPNAVIETKVMEAQLIPGYRGLIDLARRSGEILKIEARLVRRHDEFRLDYGAPQPVHHVPFIPDPSLPPEQRDPGPIVGAYMRAMLRDDPVPQVEFMTYDEIEAIRKRSKAADSGPWIQDWGEMARKTVVRRGSKYLPLTTEFRTALEMDEEAERSSEMPDAPPQVNRAAQMLLDRVQRSEAGPEASQGSEDAAEGENGAGGPSDGPTRDPGSVDPAPAQPSEPLPPAPATATAICGEAHEPDEGESFGVCTRAPEHTGGHRNDAGVWPRKRK